MYCSRCGKKLSDGTEFCPDCGVPLLPVPAVQDKGPALTAVLLALALILGAGTAGAFAVSKLDSTVERHDRLSVPAADAEPTPLEISVEQADISAFPTVRLYVRVTDPATGAAPEGLEPGSFFVKRGDAGGNHISERVTRAVKLDGNEGLSICMVADVSQSMSDIIGDVKAVMKSFLEGVQFAAGDQAELIAFSTRVRLKQEFTGDRDALAAAIDGLRVDDRTSLNDALCLAVSRAASRPGARCVMAFTDGMDNNSSATADEVIEAALRYRVPVFIIGIGQVFTEELRRVAETTGGACFQVERGGSMEDIYKVIYRREKELYLIEYTDSTPGPVPGEGDIIVGVSLEDHAGECVFTLSPAESAQISALASR